MSGEELQDDGIVEVNDEVIVNDQDSEQFESEDSGSEDDLAPSDEGQHHKKVEFTPEQQEVMNREIGKKTFKLREAERNAKALEQELRSIKAEREKVAAPVIPPMPDQFDDGYEQKVAARDQAIADHSQWRTEQAVIARQHHEAEQRLHQQRQESFEKSVEEYEKRSLRLGVSKEELHSAATVIGSCGLNRGLIDAIVQDENGPLITTYLANNPDAMEEVMSRDPVSAGIYITRNIVPKLQPRKTKTTNAPEPAPVLRGNGAPPKDKYHVEGAIFK